MGLKKGGGGKKKKNLHMKFLDGKEEKYDLLIPWWMALYSVVLWGPTIHGTLALPVAKNLVSPLYPAACFHALLWFWIMAF